MFENSGVEKFMVEKSGVKVPGLRLGVENSGVEISLKLFLDPNFHFLILLLYLHLLVNFLKKPSVQNLFFCFIMFF